MEDFLNSYLDSTGPWGLLPIALVPLLVGWMYERFGRRRLAEARDMSEATDRGQTVEVQITERYPGPFRLSFYGVYQWDVVDEHGEFELFATQGEAGLPDKGTATLKRIRDVDGRHIYGLLSGYPATWWRHMVRWVGVVLLLGCPVIVGIIVAQAMGWM